jgi:DNA-binding NtrC family response regulator
MEMAKPRVLLVDDEPLLTEALRRLLRREDYDVLTASSGTEALAVLDQAGVDVIVSDQKMPGMSGDELLARVRRDHPDTTRILATGCATLDMALRAVNEGEVYRIFTKPYNEVDMVLTIRQAIQEKMLRAEVRKLVKKVKHQSAMLRDLERANPGLTEVERDQSGAIVIDDMDRGTTRRSLRTWPGK